MQARFSIDENTKYLWYRYLKSGYIKISKKQTSIILRR